MIRSLLTTAVRRLRRHKGFVAINVVGLSLGLAATLLLGLFVERERSYDDFHDDADDIYRLVETDAEGNLVSGNTRMPAMPTLVREMPEVAAGTRVRKYNTAWFGGPNSRLEVRPTYVDSTFFDVFSFEVVHGDADDVQGGVQRPSGRIQRQEPRHPHGDVRHGNPHHPPQDDPSLGVPVRQLGPHKGRGQVPHGHEQARGPGPECTQEQVLAPPAGCYGDTRHGRDEERKRTRLRRPSGASPTTR